MRQGWSIFDVLCDPSTDTSVTGLYKTESTHTRGNCIPYMSISLANNDRWTGHFCNSVCFTAGVGWPSSRSLLVGHK
ncbi:hypothetical protein BP00DRAFT_423683 [Aspergillus indologenus CBS 114.80]|uniref:Uncharacterized protein n=1 Tax=Aspergillus indologenus CBS 114.80 TaxID=1450541 RepID=A0A2V5IY53_9EURO|nr:hypothetical protein BP00DRAFT_423683 [Aspergillus indologenus CBS 114.80]